MSKLHNSSLRGSKKLAYEDEWVRHRPEGMSEEDFRHHLASAEPVLIALKNMMEHQLENNEHTLEPDYDCPSWAHKQAHQNGVRATLKKYLKILKRPKGD